MATPTHGQPLLFWEVYNIPGEIGYRKIGLVWHSSASLVKLFFWKTVS
jgi:hypothetical protein